MKNNIFKILSLVLASGIMLTGCGNSAGTDSSEVTENTAENSSASVSQPEDNPDSEAKSDTTATVTELEVRFGDDGEPFTLHLYENDTAAAIVKHVGTSDWRLPIYHYDDFDNWEVMQYYDVPSRYEIPSDPEQITEEKAGTVYYSEPNRIILFYQDAKVSAEYTPVGYFDYSEEFLKAVQDNPVLEGWGNKIIQITKGDFISDGDLKFDNTEQEATEMKMKIQVGDTAFTATLAENSSVDALKELMADGPLTLNMSDYANMEKGADLGITLPQNNKQMNTQAGDIILYQGKTFVIYYDTNSWSLTPIGKIDDVDAETLRETLGTGDVTVTLSLE